MIPPPVIYIVFITNDFPNEKATLIRQMIIITENKKKNKTKRQEELVQS